MTNAGVDLVILLPGGKANSTQVSRPWQVANLRMLLLGLALRRRLGRRVTIRRVRYRLRGWNAPREDPLRDAVAATDTHQGVHRTVLVGHSMGGRVAAHLASRPEVVGVVALAPWWPADDAERIPADTRLVALHGTADTWTDPEASLRQCAEANARGLDARWIPMNRSGHFMIHRARSWHRLTAEAVAAMLSAGSQSTSG